MPQKFFVAHGNRVGEILFVCLDEVGKWRCTKPFFMPFLYGKFGSLQTFFLGSAEGFGDRALVVEIKRTHSSLMNTMHFDLRPFQDSFLMVDQQGKPCTVTALTLTGDSDGDPESSKWKLEIEFKS